MQGLPTVALHSAALVGLSIVKMNVLSAEARPTIAVQLETNGAGANVAIPNHTEGFGRVFTEKISRYTLVRSSPNTAFKASMEVDGNHASMEVD